MNPIQIIERYYDKGSKLYEILITHSMQVRDKALKVLDKHPELQADRQFISEAALLHDIGIFLTSAHDISCYGTHHYIEHGVLGAEILRREGLSEHALVAERHTGTGLSKEWIIEKKLPLPQRDLLPVSLEEQIICYADKFYSKSDMEAEIPVEQIVSKLARFSEENVKKFLEWHEIFS